MGQEFQLWAERPRRQSWSPAKSVSIKRTKCFLLLTSSLSFSNIRYWAFHWDSGPPTIVTLSKHKVQDGQSATQWLRQPTLFKVTFSAPQWEGLVGRVQGSLPHPPPPQPRCWLLPQAGHISIRIYYVFNPTTRIPNSSFSSSSQKPHVKWISGTARAIIDPLVSKRPVKNSEFEKNLNIKNLKTIKQIETKNI